MVQGCFDLFWWSEYVTIIFCLNPKNNGMYIEEREGSCKHIVAQTHFFLADGID